MSNKLKQLPPRTGPHKEASRAQKASRAKNWFVNFTLQHTSLTSLGSDIPLSMKSYSLAYKRDELTEKLRASVAEDYAVFRQELIDSGEFTPPTNSKKLIDK